MSEFEALGARVAGVSKDSLKSHARFRKKFGLTFPLLSDPEHRVLEAYGAWGEKQMYGKTVQGTVRTTLVLDDSGRVARVYGNVSAKGHAQMVLEDLKQ